MTKIRNKFRDERGQAILISAVFMAVLLGMAGLVLDVGSWYRAQRATQSAADASALAGAQALPRNTARAYDLAVVYANKNGGGLENGHIQFPSNERITVRLERQAPGFLAQLFDIDSVKVSAKATARARNIKSARWVAPIVVNEKHEKLQCNPNPCAGNTQLVYHHLKGGGGGDANDGAGSFGFINLKKNEDNPGTSDLGEWIRNGFSGWMDLGDYHARTGNPFSSTHVGSSLEDKIGEELLFPVYRKLTSTGSNAKYEIIGWVGFHLTGTDLHGNNEKLFGYFTQFIAEGIQVDAGSSNPDFGVTAIQLIE